MGKSSVFIPGFRSYKPTPISDLQKQINLLELDCEWQKAAKEMQVETAVQSTFDACCMAAQDVFNMGPKRAKAFSERAIYYMDEFSKMGADEVNVTTDYKGNDKVEGDIDIPATRDQIDRRLRTIFAPEDFIPFEERYKWAEHKRIKDKFIAALRRVGVKQL